MTGQASPDYSDGPSASRDRGIVGADPVARQVQINPRSASCSQIADVDMQLLTVEMDISDALELAGEEPAVLVADVVVFSANDFRAEVRIREYVLVGSLPWPRSSTITLIRPRRNGVRTQTDEHGYFILPRPSTGLFRLTIETATQAFGSPWILLTSDARLQAKSTRARPT
jgi:hypothetical protein